MIQFVLNHGIYILFGFLIGAVIGLPVLHLLKKHGVISGEEITTFTGFLKSEIEKDMKN